MHTTYTSHDLWLVKALAGAAIAFIGFFFHLDGTIAENLRIVPTPAQAQAEPAQTPQVLGVSTNSDGYTEFSPSADTRIIYVSSSEGSDNNDGLSEATPKQTIQAGLDLLRGGYPDWLLLKKGDVWINEEIGQLSGRDGQAIRGRFGRSADEMMLISSYGSGDERPELRFTQPNQGIMVAFGFAYPPEHLAIVGLNFNAAWRDTESPDYVPGDYGQPAISFLEFGENILFEDNEVRFMQFTAQVGESRVGISIDFRIRKNIFYSPYSTNSHSQCIFAWQVYELLVEDNVFERCGWNPDVTGANSTIFNRSAYLSDSDGRTIYRGNIDANGASGGVQNRTGGLVEDNLFLRTPIGIVVGYLEGGPHTANDPNIVRNNVILSSRNIDTQEQGTGITFNPEPEKGVMRHVRIYNNVIANNENPDSNYNVTGIGIGGRENMEDVQIYDNIVYNWNSIGRRGTGVSFSNRAQQIDSSFTNNVIQQPGDDLVAAIHQDANGMQFGDNVYYSALGESGAFAWDSFDRYRTRTGDTTSEFAQVEFSDPDRDIATYMDSLGIGGGYDEFMRRAKQQSRDTFDPRFTAEAVNEYVRDGFDIVRVQETPTEDTGDTPTDEDNPTEDEEVVDEQPVDEDPGTEDPVENEPVTKDPVTDEDDTATDDTPGVFSGGDTVVTTDNVNLRTGPTGEVIRILSAGTVATIPSWYTPYEQNGNTWVKLSFPDGSWGYVAADYLAHTDATPDTDTAPVKETKDTTKQKESYTTPTKDTTDKTTTATPKAETTSTPTDRIRTTDNLKVRTAPEGTEITIMPRGSVATVLSKTLISQGSYDWIRVRFDNGTEGYVADAFTAPTGTNSEIVPALSDERRQEIIAQIQALLEQVAVLQELMLQLQALEN